jgi:hypothetical protein
VAVGTYARNAASKLRTRLGSGAIAAQSTGLSQIVSGPEAHLHGGRVLRRGEPLATRSWPGAWPRLNDATTGCSEGWSRY